jgi:glycosyltransferase involved in cell wall biosynthesis
LQLKTAFITRSTWQTVPGGDTVQIEQTARHLRAMGVKADILPADSEIDYASYDLLHFFNITRPADLLIHARQCRKPYVLSPVLVDYSEYDRQYRKGFSGFIFRSGSPSFNEYIKTTGRWLLGKDKLVSKAYLWKGQSGSMKEIIAGAAAILPNSVSEQEAIRAKYKSNALFTVVPNGIDPFLFKNDNPANRNQQLVICVARIEGIKNQLNLIRALNNTEFTLVLIGGAAPGQQGYYSECRRIAAGNIQFLGHIPQDQLINYYKEAIVHVLPSWFETCGLSSLEAAAMGSRIVITDKGYTRDYFSDLAFYTDPGHPAAILESVRKAAVAPENDTLSQRIYSCNTWQNAAALTFNTYKQIITG